MNVKATGPHRFPCPEPKPQEVDMSNRAVTTSLTIIQKNHGSRTGVRAANL